MDKHISVIIGILYQFLKDNGGYSNGYETFIEGSVQCRSHSRFKWSTPSVRKLTGEEVDKRGRELHDSIRKYLEDNKIDNRLVVKEEHIEWGCYKTILYFDAPTYRIDLSGL